MKSYLENLAENSGIYKAAEGFALNNSFSRAGSLEDRSYYTLCWNSAPGLILKYELIPFSMINFFSCENVSLEHAPRQVQLVFPRELGRAALFVEYTSADPEGEKDVFLKYLGNDNPYLHELARGFQKGSEKFVHSVLMRTDLKQTGDFLEEMCRYLMTKCQEGKKQ